MQTAMGSEWNDNFAFWESDLEFSSVEHERLLDLVTCTEIGRLALQERA